MLYRTKEKAGANTEELVKTIDRIRREIEWEEGKRRRRRKRREMRRTIRRRRRRERGYQEREAEFVNRKDCRGGGIFHIGNIEKTLHTPYHNISKMS